MVDFGIMLDLETKVNIIQILTGSEVNIIRILTRGINVAQGRAAAAGNIDPEGKDSYNVDRSDSQNLFCHIMHWNKSVLKKKNKK